MILARVPFSVEENVSQNFGEALWTMGLVLHLLSTVALLVFRLRHRGKALFWSLQKLRTHSEDPWVLEARSPPPPNPGNRMPLYSIPQARNLRQEGFKDVFIPPLFVSTVGIGAAAATSTGVPWNCQKGVSEIRGTILGPYYKGILLFGGLYLGSLIFVSPQNIIPNHRLI